MNCPNKYKLYIEDCKIMVASDDGVHIFDKLVFYSHSNSIVNLSNSIKSISYKFNEFQPSSLFSSFQELVDLLKNLCNTLETYDFEFVCDTEYNTIIAKVNTVTGAIEYQNLDGSPYFGEVVICSRTKESDIVQVCVNGVNAIAHFVKENGEPNGEIFFTDMNNVIIPTPATYTVGACSSCSIMSVTGANLATLGSLNSFMLLKPDCCEVTLSTSIGSVTIPSKLVSYSSSDFDCPFTIDSVSIAAGSQCSLSDILIIKNKTK